MPPPLTIICDVNAGFGDAAHPKPPWIEPGVNCLSPTFAGDWYDTLGYGGHGDTIPKLYADVMETFRIPAHVVPVVACSDKGYATAAIGRAYAWVANEQQRMRANEATAHIQWVVTLPAEPGIAGPSESRGRERLDKLGVPLIQAAGNNRQNLDAARSSVHYSGTAIVVGCADPYSGYGRSVVKAHTPPGYGTSGATMVAAAWITAVRIWQPAWPIEHVVEHIRRMRELPGIGYAVRAVPAATKGKPEPAPFQPRRVAPARGGS